MEYAALFGLILAALAWGVWNRRDARKDAEKDIGEREYNRGFIDGGQNMILEIERVRRLDAAAAQDRNKALLFAKPHELSAPTVELLEIDSEHEIVVRKRKQRKPART